GRLERALMDSEHRLGEPRPAPVDPLMRPPVIAPGPQRRTLHRRDFRRSDQDRSWLVDRLVDALVTQPHLRPVRKPGTQMTGDLWRAPALADQAADHLAQLWVGFHTASVRAGPSDDGLTMSLERPVGPAGAGVAAQLARDRRRRPTELGGD